MELRHLTTLHEPTPLGIDPGCTPYFGWQLHSETPAAARLYLTCLGVYRLTVNGKRPDDREFAPEHTSYRKTLCYQTYDVTSLLHAGRTYWALRSATAGTAARRPSRRLMGCCPTTPCCSSWK